MKSSWNVEAVLSYPGKKEWQFAILNIWFQHVQLFCERFLVLIDTIVAKDYDYESLKLCALRFLGASKVLHMGVSGHPVYRLYTMINSIGKEVNKIICTGWQQICSFVPGSPSSTESWEGLGTRLEELGITWIHIFPLFQCYYNKKITVYISVLHVCPHADCLGIS